MCILSFKFYLNMYIFYIVTITIVIVVILLDRYIRAFICCIVIVNFNVLVVTFSNCLYSTYVSQVREITYLSIYIMRR